MIGHEHSSGLTGEPNRSGTRLFKYFLVISLVSAATTILVLAFCLRAVLNDLVLREAEKDAIRISYALRDIVVHPFVDKYDGESSTIVIPETQLATVDQQMRGFLSAFAIVKIKIFDTDTRIIYSTDRKIVGQLNESNEKLAKALNGEASSKYETKEHVWDLKDEEHFDVGIVETYVPIRGPGGKIIGSFEIYKNVTDDFMQANQALFAGGIVLFALVAAVFSVLALLMWRATRAITRKTAEAEDSKEKYRQLFSAETHAILLFDADSRQLVDMNKAAGPLYGLASGEGQGRAISEFIVDSSRADELLQAAATGEHCEPCQCDHIRTDGSVFPAEMTGGRFTTKGREMLFFVVQDTTERTRIQEELKSTVEELERFNRLAVGREERMIELKCEVNEMAHKAGAAPPYDLAFAEPGKGVTDDEA